MTKFMMQVELILLYIKQEGCIFINRIVIMTSVLFKLNLACKNWKQSFQEKKGSPKTKKPCNEIHTDRPMFMLIFPAFD